MHAIDILNEYNKRYVGYLNYLWAYLYLGEEAVLLDSCW